MNVKISELPTIIAPTVTDVIPVVQNGVTKNMPNSAQFLNYDNVNYDTVKQALDQLFTITQTPQNIDGGTF